MSQPSRLVMWTCHRLGLDFEFNQIKVDQGDHTTEEFLKINPNALFPVLDDEGFILWESHAIVKYLVEKYDPSGKSGLYPSDLKARANINKWLDWKHSNIRVGAAGIVRRRVMKKIMKDYSKHSMRFDLEEIPESREARILLKSLQIMDDHLARTPYFGGEKETLADLALCTEVAQLQVLPADEPPPFGGDLSKDFPARSEWMQRMINSAYFQESHKGFFQIKSVIDKMRAKSKL